MNQPEPEFITMTWPELLYSTILAHYTSPPQHGLVYMLRDSSGLTVHKVTTFSPEEARIYGADGVVLSA